MGKGAAAQQGGEGCIESGACRGQKAGLMVDPRGTIEQRTDHLIFLVPRKVSDSSRDSTIIC